MQRCLASIAVMRVQAVEAFLTALALAALPGLPYLWGNMGYPQPMRLSPGPTESTAAGASVLPIIPIFYCSPFPPPLLLIEAPGVRSNSVRAPVPLQLLEPASLQNRCEALQAADPKLCDVPCNSSHASSACERNALIV